MFTRIAVDDFGAIQLTTVRSLVASVTLLPLVFIGGHWSVFKKYWLHLVVVALISTALPFSFMTITTQYTSAGFAAILNALTPIFTAIIAWLWMKEYLSIPAIIGIGLSLLGVMVMIMDTQSISADIVFIPVLCGLIAAALYGLTGNYSAKFLVDVPAIAIAGGCQCFSALILLPISFVIWPDDPISTSSWISAITLGILCTSIGYVLFFQLIAKVGATKTMIVTYLIPVFAIVWGMIFLDESITTKMLIGAAFILTGITLTSGILKKNKSPATEVNNNET